MIIKLLPFTKNDIPNLIAWVDKPGASDLWASRTYQYPLSEEKVLKQLEKTQRNPVELLIFKIVCAQSMKTVGHVELDKLDHYSKSIRIARFFVDPKFRQMRIASQATELLIKYCFEELDLNRIEIFSMENNLIALELYKKSGFKEEGFLRENMVLNGKKFGSYALSILKSDCNN